MTASCELFISPRSPFWLVVARRPPMATRAGSSAGLACWPGSPAGRADMSGWVQAGTVRSALDRDEAAAGDQGLLASRPDYPALRGERRSCTACSGTSMLFLAG